MFPLIPIAPDPIALSFGPINIGWYGIGYVIAPGRDAARHPDARSSAAASPRHHVWNALLLVGALALIGGRLYHVIDQWQLYQNNLLAIILPPYAGLGLYGGVAGRGDRDHHLHALAASAAAAVARLGRRRHALRAGHRPLGQLLQPGAVRAADRCAVGHRHRLRPPRRRIPLLASTRSRRPASTRSSSTNRRSNILGGFIVLFISRRYLAKVQPGDLVAFWGIWYGATRGLLEFFRADWNWKLGGIPTAQLIGIALVIVGIVWIAYNHRPGTKPYPYPEPIRPGPPPPDPFADDEDEGPRTTSPTRTRRPMKPRSDEDDADADNDEADDRSSPRNQPSDLGG